MDLSKLTQGEKIVLAAGVLLIIDLLFLPWHSVLGLHISAVDAPNSGYAIIALLLAIIMVGQIVAAKLTSANLPDPPLPWSQLHLFGGGAIAVLLLLKLIAETSLLGFGAYLGVILGLAIAYGAYTMREEDSVLV